MQSTEVPGRHIAAGDVIVYLLGVAGLAACLTALFLSMRAVMDIGGACAEGGPFVPVRRCPEGVPLLMTLIFPLLFVFGGLVVWRGSRLGGSYGGLVFLAWPALFLSLGWNFLEYAFKYPEEGIVWGWLICGIVFVVIGGVPLLAVLLPDQPSRGRGRARAARAKRDEAPGQTAEPDAEPTWQERRRLAELRRLQRTLKQVAAMRAPMVGASAVGVPGTGAPTPAAGGGDTSDDLVSRLERLADLRRSGALSDVEFQAAKRQLLAAELPSGAGEGS